MKTKKSLCEDCANSLQLTYLSLPFKFDKNTGEQLNTELQEYNEHCIYLHFRYVSTWDEMAVKTCNRFLEK